MNIALFTDSYIKSNSTESLAASSISSAAALSGHKILIISADSDNSVSLEKNILLLNGKDYPSAAGRCVKKSALLPMEEALNKFMPDVIHINSLSELGKAGYSYASKKDIPVVTSVYSLYNLLSEAHLPPFKMFKALNKNSFFKTLIKDSKLIIGFSDTLSNDIEEIAGVSRKIYKVTPAFDASKISLGADNLETIKELKIRFGLSHGKIGILFHYLPADHQSFVSLIDYWSSYVKPSDNLKLIVTSSALNKDDILELISTRGISETVTITSDLSKQELEASYIICDALIIMSESSYINMSVPTAISLGMPIIVNSKSANASLVKSGISGFIFSDNSELNSIIPNFSHLDSQKRMKLRKLVHSVSEDFSINILKTEIDKAYRFAYMKQQNEDI